MKFQVWGECAVVYCGLLVPAADCNFAAPKVVRCLTPPYQPHFSAIIPFLTLSPHLPHLLITARGGPPSLCQCVWMRQISSSNIGVTAWDRRQTRESHAKCVRDLTGLNLHRRFKFLLTVPSILLALLVFWQRVSIACYAKRCLSYDRFCPTVWPSVTVRYHAKTTPATIMRSSLEGIAPWF